MLLVLIIIFAIIFLFSDHLYNNSIFLKSIGKGMELTEESEVVHDKLKYKDPDKPIYYDFVPDVVPMS